MNGKKMFCIIVTIMMILFLRPYIDVQALPKNRILVLNSYHRGYEWTSSIEEGLKSTLIQDGRNIDLQFEYMDAKRIYSEEYVEKLVELYKIKYREVKFDAIVSSDNYAFEFLLKYKNDIFGDIPQVFCGVNNLENYTLKENANLTGITGGVAIKSNIDVILRLHPNTEKIVIITDNTSIGYILEENVNEVLKNNKFPVPIHIIKNSTFEFTMQKVEKLKKNDAILYMASAFKEKDGEVLSGVEGVKIISQQVDLPIYGTWGIFINNGVIGGKMGDGNEQGKIAAYMIERILDGVSAKDIPIVKDGGDKFYFDYMKLKEFNIGINELPNGSKIINEPTSFYSISKKNVTQAIVATSVVLFGIIITLIANILERKKVEEFLKHSREEIGMNLRFLTTLFDTIPNPIFYKDTEGKYLDFNKAFVDYVGFSEEEIVNHTIFNLAESEYAKASTEIDRKLLESKGKRVYESKIRHPDGSNRDVIITKATFLSKEDKVQGIVGVIVDISERKRMEEELRRMSTTDKLTQIYNRTKFDESLYEAVESAKNDKGKLSIIMFDIDYFKKINDTYGHDIGDAILISIAKLVKTVIRKTDVFARWGGEEFMILAIDSDKYQAEALAERIRKTIEFFDFDKTGTVTCSFGVTEFREDDSLEDFIKRADVSLYEAKRQGKNKVIVN